MMVVCYDLTGRAEHCKRNATRPYPVIPGIVSYSSKQGHTSATTLGLVTTPTSPHYIWLLSTLPVGLSCPSSRRLFAHLATVFLLHPPLRRTRDSQVPIEPVTEA
jgi:hypothetical protein